MLLARVERDAYEEMVSKSEKETRKVCKIKERSELSK